MASSSRSRRNSSRAGVAPNLRGITNTSSIQALAFTTSLIITARKMATALENVDLPDMHAFYFHGSGSAGGDRARHGDPLGRVATA
jgi:hypothetical protein